MAITHQINCRLDDETFQMIETISQAQDISRGTAATKLLRQAGELLRVARAADVDERDPVPAPPRGRYARRKTLPNVA